MTDRTIRPATPADIADITAIYGHSVRTETASFEFDPPGEAEMGRRMAAFIEAGFPYLVCTAADGKVLGYAYASHWRPRIGYNHTIEDSLYIAPDAQRQGVGRMLLRTLIADCEALGFRQMVAVIGDSRHAASIALHQSEGFAVVGRLPTLGHKFGLWLDSVLMQRSLGPGAAQPPARPIR
jgi:L-amino acid N-acyltransferase YncA